MFQASFDNSPLIVTLSRSMSVIEDDEVEEMREIERGPNKLSPSQSRVDARSGYWLLKCANAKLPSSRATLRSPSPLRTVLDTFASHGSSIQ